MTREEAVKLTSEAIQAGIFNDLGSGSNVDVCVITPEKTTLMRNYITPNVREKKMRDYKFARGTTAVLNEKVMKRANLASLVTVEDVPVEKMDVDQ